jgi:hypothetical protein
MGSLDYLATWIAWERDSEKRGQDAASSWKLANIQTWECTNMGYCDDLYTTLQALLAATQALECCGEQDITDGERYTDPVVDGEGDVPQNIIDAGYAEDLEDWEGFADYKCMISHLAVDHIEAFFRGMGPVFNDAGIAVGGVGVAFALGGAILALIGLPITFAIIGAVGGASAVWYWIAQYGESAVEDIADEIAIHHDALACAIYNGDGVADAISDFNDEVDSLFGAIDAAGIKAVGFEPQLRAMYSGRYNQQDIAEKLADQGYETSGYVCICDEEDPPPEGWHLEYPELDQFEDFTWCSNEGCNYNPSTGVLNILIEPTGAPAFEMRANFNFLGYYGYVIDILSLSVATKVQDQGHGLIAGVQYEAQVHVGENYAGLNYYRMTPSDPEWVAWLSQWDYISSENHSGLCDVFMLAESEQPEISLYSVSLRIRGLVPDE